MIIKEIIKLTPTKENNFSKIDKNIPSYSGIYFIYNENFELIYIGKAKNIRLRILQHSSDKTPREGDGSNYTQLGLIGSKIPLGESKYYSYILIEDEEERDLKELILINILQPKYNSKFKYNKYDEIN